jgi:hypothetical protein
VSGATGRRRDLTFPQPESLRLRKIAQPGTVSHVSPAPCLTAGQRDALPADVSPRRAEPAPQSVGPI